MDADSYHHRDRDFCLGRGDIRQLQDCAEGYAGHLSDRQTVDVETAAAEPAEYAAWLSGESGDVNPVSAGEHLFTQLACVTCHLSNGTGRAPSLNGVFGANVLLADGSIVVADEA